MKLSFYYIHLRLFFLTLLCAVSTLRVGAQDTLLMAPVLDTIAPVAASTTARRGGVAPKDSAVVDLSKIRFSSDGIDEVISYGARDSMWFDVANKQVHLYGLAKVKYTTLEITAGYILIDYANNEVTADMIADSSGQMTGAPDFKDKDQAFSSKKIRYNFKTKKGIIYEARTKQEDLYVLGAKAKFIGGPEGDTTARNTIYNQDAIITTCDAEHPHFGIHTRKLKVVPDKVVVTGLSNLELAGIPTPFVLPFGFYPITKTRKAGVIIPQDFNFAEQEGLGLRDFGWYQPINDNMDAKVLFNAFVNGSFGVAGNLNYNYKYRSSGTVNLHYNRRVNENDKAEKVYFPSFGLQINHRQDRAAHPSRTIGGSVNIETNRDSRRNQNDFASVYRNQLTSNLNYSKSFPGKPYQFNLGFTHNQNTQTRKMNITLPEATFTLQRIYPLKQENRVGKEKWYEKLSLTYNSQLRNSLSEVPDTTLFTRSTLRNAKSGIQHRASTDFNMKLAKYINITPNISADWSWYPYAINRQFDPTPKYKIDTIFQGTESIGTRIDSNGTKWGTDTLIRNYGFYQYLNYNAGISASTSIFGTVQFKKGWLKGIRHKIAPSASIGFGPDYSKNTRIFKEVETSSRPGRSNKRKYSIFDEGIYGRPSASPRSMVVSYSILNVLEIKHFSKRDTTGRGKKTKIFDNLNFSGTYNISADSLRWSPVGTNGVFRLFKGLTTLNWRVTFDPYIRNEKGVRVNQYTVKNGGGIMRLDQFGLNMNTNLTINQIRGLIGKKLNKDSEKDPKKANNANAGLAKAPDDLLGWFDRFSLSHYISYERQYVNQTNRDTFLISQHNLSIRGDIPISSKWAVNISNISYDFKEKAFVYPDLGITRDLHCWQMSLSWQPTRGTYFFTIAAKPGTFQFLKVPYRQNNFDGNGGF